MMISFQHTKDSIIMLSVIQYMTFQKHLIVLQMIFGVLFSTISFFLPSKNISILFLIFGCWLLISWKQIPIFRAQKIIRFNNGNFPKTVYYFHDSTFSVSNNHIDVSIGYKNIMRLVFDQRYYYIFINKDGAYMLPRFQDVKEENSFKDFIKEKTNLMWLSPKGIWQINFKSILVELKNTKKRKIFRGN